MTSESVPSATRCPRREAVRGGASGSRHAMGWIRRARAVGEPRWLAGARVRACIAAAWLCATGCSLALDFSDQAIPRDAAPDAAFDPADCDYREPNETPATAAAITAADTGPAAICPATPADRDFYRIAVPAGTTAFSVRIDFAHRTAGDLDLRLLDRAGATTIAESHGFADSELIACPGAAPACPALAADDYVIEVFPGVTGATNRYTITLTLTPP